MHIVQRKDAERQLPLFHCPREELGLPIVDSSHQPAPYNQGFRLTLLEFVDNSADFFLYKVLLVRKMERWLAFLEPVQVYIYVCSSSDCNNFVFIVLLH